MRQVPQAVADMRGIEERGLLLFIDNQDEERGLPITILTVDEGREAFPPGSFRVLNLSGAPLLGRIGLVEELFEFGFSRTLEFDPSDRDPMRVRFSVFYKNRWKVVLSTASQSHSEMGTLIVLRPPPSPASLRVRAYLLRERTY